jgi:hypothetical protein
MEPDRLFLPNGLIWIYPTLKTARPQTDDRQKKCLDLFATCYTHER